MCLNITLNLAVPYDNDSFCFMLLVTVDSSTAHEKIREHYVDLSKLKINSLLGLLYCKKVITLEEKKILQSKPLESDGAMCFLDDILIPSLENNVTEKYTSFLQILQESSDTVLQSMAKRIGMKILATCNYTIVLCVLSCQPQTSTILN